jgi:cation:H+ antiporter
MLWTILFLVIGFALLIKSADILVDGAAGIAKRLNVPKMIIGLTLVAFGTSAPEGTVSIIAAIEKSPGISVGNIIGSNIINIALILGIAALFRRLDVSDTTISKGLPLGILAAFVLVVLGQDQFFQNHSVIFNRFTLGDGIIFICFFIVFLSYLYIDMKSARVSEKIIEKKEEIHYKESYWYLLLLVFGGLAGLMAGGKLVVDSAVFIAHYFNVSETIIGLTVVAIGTSLPELATSLMAAIKRESDIAVGNIVGSNVFNIFLVLGVTSIIHPMEFDPKLLIDANIMLAITVVLFLMVMRTKMLSKKNGIFLVSIYVFYLCFLFFRETSPALFL